MKKFIVAMFAMVAAVMFTACSSVDSATTFNNVKITDVPNAAGVAHIHGDIWGIYLFNLPLFSGSSKQPGRCAIFTDTVQADNAVSMITKKASTDFEATSMTGITTEKTTIPLLLFFRYKDIQVSGNAIR